MDWREKLRKLIDAHQQGHAAVRIGFSYRAPVPPKQAEAVVRRLPFELPQALGELYAITDGMYIALDQMICSLLTNEHTNLLALNERFLTYLRNECQTARIDMIFGSDGAGSFFCVTDDGAVVIVDSHSPAVAKYLSDSVDRFLDDFCMGPGYIRYYRPSPDNYWLSVLQDLGFLAGEDPASAYQSK